MRKLILVCLASRVVANKPLKQLIEDDASAAKPLVLPSSFATAPTATAAAGSPNVVVLMVDDLGYGDVSFMAKDSEAAAALDTAGATPTLAALAAEGVVLKSFYASPTCTPSRASFFTGKYPTSLGLQDSVVHATEPRGLSLEEDILPRRLASAGYKALGVGKWHVGFHQPQYLPVNRGFDEYFGILTGGGGHFSHVSTGSFTMRGPYKATTVELSGYNLWHNADAVDDEAKLVKNRHTTDLYTDVAVAQLSACHSSYGDAVPFYLHLSYQAVHAPMEVPAAYVDGTVTNGCDAIDDSDVTVLGGKRQVLCGMLSQLDASASKIVSHLKSDAMAGRWDNTVLLFLSDNGGVESHGSSNAPFKGGKGSYYEGGMRVPAFIGGGFTVAALAASGSGAYASNALVHVADLHATVLDLAGSPFTAKTRRRQLLASSAAEETAAGPALDGVSQWAFLVSGGETSAEGKAFMPRTEILHNVNTEAFGSGGALRVGDYKLLVEAKVSESEVYTYAQHVLQDGDFDLGELGEVVGKKLLKNGGTYKIFNVAKNPGEREDAACSEDEGGVEACGNLAGNEDHAQVEIALMDTWKAARDASGASSVTFQDDGPLCDPSLFGGYWSSWRDELGVPYATYATVPTSTHFDAETGAPTHDASVGVSAQAPQAGSPATGGQYDTAGIATVKGLDADGTGAKTWKHAVKLDFEQVHEDAEKKTAASSPLALVAGGSMLGALVALAAVVVGQRVKGGSQREGASSKYTPVAGSEDEL